MAYSKEQLQQLQQQADRLGGFNSDTFKQKVTELQGEGAYDKLRTQLEDQQANLQQKQQTPITPEQQIQQEQASTKIEPQQPIEQKQREQTPTQDNIQTNQMVDAGILPEEQRENIPQQPTSTQEVKPTTDFSKISNVEQWKTETGGGLNNLESWIENRYGTLAEKKGNKLVADIGGTTYEWELDQSGNPIKKAIGKTGEIISEDVKILTDFDNLLQTNPTREELNSYIVKNKDYVEQFKPKLKTYFKNKDNVEFYNKYSTFTPNELFTAYKEGKIIVGSDKYNSLPDELKQGFEEYKRLQEKTSDGISYTDMNNNVLSLNDYITQINSLFSSNLTEEYNVKVNSAEMTTLKNDMTSKAKEIADIDNTLKNLEDDLLERYPGITEGRLAALMRREQKALYRERDDLVVDYNSLQSSYSMQMDEIKYGIEMAKYEDSVNRANFETALTLYQTDRARMDEQQRYELEQQTALLAEQRQYAMQKELILFQEEINANKGGDYIDKGDGNLYYVKDGKTLATLEGLGTVTSSTSDDRYDYKIYEGENGTYTAFTIDKETNKITQQTYDINGNLGGGYLSTLGNGQITSYGGIHDGGKGLDIDGSIGDPIYTPMSGRVIKVEDYGDKTFGKSIVVELEDGKKVRYSHLDQFNGLEVGDYSDKNVVFDKGAILGTVGNTGYVIPGEAGDGSHIDIQIEGMNAYEVRDYLKGIGKEEEVLSQDYDNNFKALFAKFNSGDLNTAEFNAVKEEFGSIAEFGRQAFLYGKKIDTTQALPQLDDYKADLEYLLNEIEETEGLSNIASLGGQSLQVALGNLGFGDFAAVLDNVKNKVAFQELVRLKQNGATFGSLTEKEFQNIGSSTEIGKLKMTASSDTWKEALTRLIRDVDAVRGEIMSNNPYYGQIDAENIMTTSDNDVLNYLNK